MDAITVVNQILEPLVAELNDVRQEVLFTRRPYGASWERMLRKYDELAIRKLQTERILKELQNNEVETMDATDIRV